MLNTCWTQSQWCVWPSDIIHKILDGDNLLVTIKMWALFCDSFWTPDISNLFWLMALGALLRRTFQVGYLSPLRVAEHEHLQQWESTVVAFWWIRRGSALWEHELFASVESVDLRLGADRFKRPTERIGKNGTSANMPVKNICKKMRKSLRKIKNIKQ